MRGRRWTVTVRNHPKLIQMRPGGKTGVPGVSIADPAIGSGWDMKQGW